MAIAFSYTTLTFFAKLHDKDTLSIKKCKRYEICFTCQEFVWGNKKWEQLNLVKNCIHLQKKGRMLTWTREFGKNIEGLVSCQLVGRKIYTLMVVSLDILEIARFQYLVFSYLRFSMMSYFVCKIVSNI